MYRATDTNSVSILLYTKEMITRIDNKRLVTHTVHTLVYIQVRKKNVWWAPRGHMVTSDEAIPMIQALFECISKRQSSKVEDSTGPRRSTGPNKILCHAAARPLAAATAPVPARSSRSPIHVTMSSAQTRPLPRMGAGYKSC